MTKTSIEWTERVWNFLAGCSVVSPGCTNCYAMRRAARIERMNPALAHYRGLTKPSKAGPVWTGRIGVAEHKLLEPLRVKKPAMWFVNSMSDLFHESVPNEVIDRAFAIMALCPQHTFQVLTKRPARMRSYMDRACGRIADAAISLRRRRGDTDMGIVPLAHVRPGHPWWPLPNVWLGVSVEDQKRADERIPDLLATPAAVRFISAEPLLGPVDIKRWIPTCYECGSSCGLRLPGPPKIERCTNCGEECGPDTDPMISEGCPKCSGDLEFVCPDCGHYMVYQHPDTPNIDWVIVGGESGPDARPMHPDWARSLRDQCAAEGVPFFFKQVGEWAWPTDDQHHADYVAACNGKGAWPHDTLMAADGTILPGDAMKIGSRAYIRRIGKKAAGRLLDGVEHNAMPEARP